MEWLRLRMARLQWRLVAVTVVLLVFGFVSLGAVQYVTLRSFLVYQKAQTQLDRWGIIGDGIEQHPELLGGGGAIYDRTGQLVTGRSGEFPNPGWIDPSRADLNCAEPQTVVEVPSYRLRAFLQRMLPGFFSTCRYRVLSLAGSPDELAVFTYLRDGNVVVGETPLNGIDGVLAADMAIYVLAAWFILLVATLLAALLTSRSLRGLRRVGAVAGEISAGAYERRTGMVGDDEVGRLAMSFDRMVDRLQEQIERERQSEARMRRFLADASHELRTPVTGVLGHLEVLQRGASLNRRHLDESLGSMHVAATRMSRLVHDLLAIARLDQADLQLRRSRVEVGPLLAEACQLASGSTREHDVEVLPCEGRLSVLGDRDAIERILLNLLDNAGKYTPPGTTIRVGARGTEGRPGVEVFVADQGPGIPVADRERVFERLYRGAARVDGPVAGNGLGLSICQALARRQGGDIRIMDTPGGGSTFVVRLPGGIDGVGR